MSHSSYVDNLKVKISERYKPPRKISLAVAYSQRLALNKQIQDNLPDYDFSNEFNALEHVRQYRNFKKEQQEARRARLEKAREELKNKRKEEEESEESTSQVTTEPVSANQSINNYPTTSNILLPTLATYSNILTPIPLKNYPTTQNCPRQSDKSPFNLSDFENDTSSPFDNMELQSINDLEVLAQVLKSDSVNTTPSYTYSNLNNQSNVPTTHHHAQHSLTSMGHPVVTSQMHPSYAYNSYNVPYNLHCAPSNYSHTNGYYYNTRDFNTAHMYSEHSKYDFPTSDGLSRKSSFKSVPDIVKSVEEELGNTHIDNNATYITNSSAATPTRPKSTDAACFKARIEQDAERTLKELPENQQKMCRSISAMGFPLDRVVRVCKLFEADQKKMVEHLLTLSELLDLGFSETSASNALFNCDNDRDKALDTLIS